MKPAQQGFLLLTSHLGDPERKVLTAAQFRGFAQRMAAAERKEPMQELTCEDLTALGYDAVMAQRIVNLLSQEQQLDWYLRQGRERGCVALTRIDERYPHALRKRLGLEAPGCLWAKGNISLLEQPLVALVGSRQLNPENADFAREVGNQAARQGFTLVSGNALGADQTAQTACLEAGGKVISVVADKLENKPCRPNVLWLSEDSFDGAFSAFRALSRNRVIHSLGLLTFVAQSDLGKGGTWNGTQQNLKKLWTPVCCYDDGSAACDAFVSMGAEPVHTENLQDFAKLAAKFTNLIGR